MVPVPSGPTTWSFFNSGPQLVPLLDRRNQHYDRLVKLRRRDSSGDGLQITKIMVNIPFFTSLLGTFEHNYNYLNYIHSSVQLRNVVETIIKNDNIAFLVGFSISPGAHIRLTVVC